jgi:uncharacterized protein YcbX
MLNTVKKSQDLFKNRPWLTFLELVILGTVVLAVCALLLGCGSDTTPGGAVKGEKAKTASIPPVKKGQVPTMLMMGEKGASKPGGGIKKEPERKSVLMDGITLEEMEARNAAAIKMAQSPTIEVMPGVTLEEMEKRIAAAVKTAQSANIEVIPGVTLEEMKARNAAAVKMAQSANIEVMPGVTLEQMKARNAAAVNAPAKPPVNQGKREIPPPVGGK